MIEKFKQIEKLINDYDFFSFFTFDEFMNFQIECLYENCFDENDNDFIEQMHYINQFKNDYNCNNENSIVLMYNCDDDEYLTINFENNILIISQNVDIEHVNDNVTRDALYEIFFTLFCEHSYFN